MDREEFQKILDKYNRGVANDEEKEIIRRFENHRKENNLDFWGSWNTEEENKAKTDILSSISKGIADLEYNKKKRQVWWSAAASLLLVSTFAWLLLVNRSEEPDQEVTQVSYITKTAQRGQKLTVKLSDGSLVKLNSESSITYPTDFTKLDIRDIQLSGEAFFEVAEDKSKPFQIGTGNLKTTVLGTSFNVNAYTEKESIAVTVVTGKVQVAFSGQQIATNSYIEPIKVLTPSQQAVFNKQTQDITISEINVDKYLAWKEGILLLDRTSLEDAAKMLERWYDIDITFRNEGIKNCVINGKFRNDQLQNMLDNIQFLTGIEYEFLDTRKIMLSGKSCN